MLSDLSCNTLPFDIPVLPDTSTALPEEDPLNFDDLLDIAREYEFTRTITHIWPCEEDPTVFPETGLEDIFAEIVPISTAENSLPPPTESAMNVRFDSIHLEEIHLHRPESVSPAPDANTRMAIDPVALPKNDGRVRAETRAPTNSILQGWSPPDGSQFLDLDDSLMLPRSTKDMWIAPWLAVFPASPEIQPAGNTKQPLPTASGIGDVQSQRIVTWPTPTPVSVIEETTENSRKENVPDASSPVQPSTRATREPIQVRLATSSQVAMTSRAKPLKSRLYSAPSAAATGTTSSAKYAKPPRGGIPPHIARSVTRANILRAEKERKVFRDAFSNTTTGEGKKPSVLRGAAVVERSTSKIVSSGGGAKKVSDPGENGEKQGRATKRARVGTGRE